MINSRFTTANLKCQVLAILCLCALPLLSFGQSIQLSAEQQQLLNSLPPAQRQQATDAMRQLENSRATSQNSSLNESAEIPQTVVESTDTRAAESKLLAQPRSRVVLTFRMRESLTTDERRAVSMDPVLQSLPGRRLYVLDDVGVLSIEGLREIPLLGLSESDITMRLATEPEFGVFHIDSHILSQKPMGVEALRPFGHDVFSSGDSDLTAPSSGPVPQDYILGPGDSIRIQLFGNMNGIYEYEVSRDGILNLPELGPITVAGIPFSEFRSSVGERVKEMLIGTQVSVTMGNLRTIRVFVLGDVERPGSYVVSGLSTMSAALYRSGGVTPIGSLRDIQLKRAGKVVASLDAYDLLIRGDTSGNHRLQPGDVVFVPPAGKTVSIGGAINRPAIYEVKRLTSAADLVKLAGGLTPTAFAEGARLERVSVGGERTVVAVNLNDASANSVRIEKGDVLIIPEILPELENSVELAGHVYRPGKYPWRSGMRLSDLVGSFDELKPGFDPGYALIRRESAGGDKVEAVSANLAKALSAPGSGDDLLLQAGDAVNFFALSLGRQRVIQPLLAEMKMRATIDAPAGEVQISGNVRSPGSYPLEAGMRVSDLIRAGGNLLESAYAYEAELTSYEVGPGGTRESNTRKIDLFAIRNGNADADVELSTHDYLIINRAPEWDTIWTVSLEGEVRFPGRYRVRRDETLADVVRRAGGPTDAAFLEGAIFIRESLKIREHEQIMSLARRMEADLASLSLQAADTSGAETLTTGQALLQQLRETDAVGRLVIDLEHELAAGVDAVEIRDGDRLLIPSRSQVVTVIGETQQNTSHLYSSEMSRDDYIALSGGLTRHADKKLIYIVRANGAVIAGKKSGLFGKRRNFSIRPGDTIVVPLDTSRVRPLTFWTSVTQILYQGAIAVAAIKTFDN